MAKKLDNITPETNGENTASVEESVAKIISMIGIEREDAAFYLGTLLSTENQPVLLVDNTMEQRLFRIASDEKKDVAYIRNMTFIHHAVCSDNLLKTFKYIIVLHGSAIDKLWWDNSFYHLVITDFDRFHLEDLADSVTANEIDLSRIVLMIANRYTTKINEKMIAKALNLPKDVLEEFFEIQPEPEVEAARIALQYNGMAKMSALPKYLKQPLYRIYLAVAQPKKAPNINNLFKDVTFIE